MGLPPRTFLYTFDQIAALLQVEVATVKNRYIYYDGLNVGAIPRKVMLARNIDPEYRLPTLEEPEGYGKAEWRVAEAELIRWLRVMGFRIYDTGWVQR